MSSHGVIFGSDTKLLPYENNDKHHNTYYDDDANASPSGSSNHRP